MKVKAKKKKDAVKALYLEMILNKPEIQKMIIADTRDKMSALLEQDWQKVIFGKSKKENEN